MKAGRLFECLSTLRWRETDLADAVGRDLLEVEADDRSALPLGETAGLEALIKAHPSVPSLREMKFAVNDPVPHELRRYAQLPLEMIT